MTLYGRLAEGGSFLMRDGRERPRFWAREMDAAAAAPIVDEVHPRRGMREKKVACVELPLPLGDRLQDAGIADIRFAYCDLIGRSIRGALEIRGPGAPARAWSRSSTTPRSRPRTSRPRSCLLFRHRDRAAGEAPLRHCPLRRRGAPAHLFGSRRPAGRHSEQLRLALSRGRGLEPLRIWRPSFPGGPSGASVRGRGP